MKASKQKTGSLRLTRREAFQFRPIKNVEVSEVRLETGCVCLSYPMKFRPLVAAVIRRLGGSSPKTWTKRVQLDELGTAVWDLIDGTHTVGELVQIFAGKFQLHAKEADVSVTQFLRELGKRGLIGMK